MSNITRPSYIVSGIPGTLTIPPSCKCSTRQQSSTSGSREKEECDEYECTCICDMNKNKCDLNCCCDVDCQEEEKNQIFTQQCDDNLLSSVEEENWVEMCYDRSQFEDVNIRDKDIVEYGTLAKIYKGSLCVKADNSAIKGKFFTDPGYLSSSISFSQFGEGIKDHDYNTVATTTIRNKKQQQHQENNISNNNNNDFSKNYDTSYKLGDFIPVFWFDGKIKAYKDLHKRAFRMPYPSDSGLCNDLNAIEFGKDIVTSKCFRKIMHVDDLSLMEQCETVFSLQYFTGFYVGRTENTVPLSNSDLEGRTDNNNPFVPITIRKYTSDTSSHENIINKQHLSPQTVWDEERQVCVNAVEKIRYHFQYNPENGSIVAIHADAIVKDLDMHYPAATTTTAARGIYQEFSVFFFSSDSSSSSNSNNKVQEIEHMNNKKSGNPGYLFGFPTLAGMYFPANKTISFLNTHDSSSNGALSVMDTGTNGQCNTVSPTGSIIGFGEDMIVGCTQKFHKAELETLCTTSSTTENHPFLSIKKVGTETMYTPKCLQTFYNIVGIYGNADPLDITQWLPIPSPFDDYDLDDNVVNKAVVKSRVWIESESRCEGIPTRVRYHFLWTYVGNSKHPQAKIISAKVDYDFSDPLTHILDSTQTQNFEFTSTVSWAYIHPDSAVVYPPPPSLLFTVPNDFFYPFQIETASSAAGRVMTFIPLLHFVVLVLFLIL